MLRLSLQIYIDIDQSLTCAIRGNSYLMSFKKKKKTLFFTLSSKQKCINLKKKKNNIEKNGTVLLFR